MAELQRLSACCLSVIVVLAGVSMRAQQAGDPATLIKEKLVSEIKLTKATAAHDDIVTAGDVIVLHKDGLMMCSSDSAYAYSNTYQNGVLSGNLNNRAKDAIKKFGFGKLPFGGGGSASDAAKNGCSSRKFVAGEKFWVTDIEIASDNSGIIVSTFSDPYNNTRYYGEIKFPFPDKHSAPPVDQEVKTVEEVLTAQPPDDSKQGGDNNSAAQNGAAAPQNGAAPPQNGAAPAPSGPAAAPAAAAAIAPIAPPPPPPDQPPPPPKTISVGQTRDVVIATWGQPTKDIKLSTKEILVYSDMKVTLVSGKVSDVQ
jgi:hypothetical protein